jgi:hypothetical protein
MPSHTHDNTKIKLHEGTSIGDVRSIYLYNVYQQLLARGKAVVVIGRLSDRITVYLVGCAVIIMI